MTTALSCLWPEDERDRKRADAPASEKRSQKKPR